MPVVLESVEIRRDGASCGRGAEANGSSRYREYSICGCLRCEDDIFHPEPTITVAEGLSGIEPFDPYR